MGEDGRAVAFQMLVEPDAGTGLGHDRCERGLADLKWILIGMAGLLSRLAKVTDGIVQGAIDIRIAH
jgi:hypothetical protein